MNLTPIEYEQYCASHLQLEGWHIRSTAVSGDQGADIIAESATIRLVVQCKQYSQSVGNAAVQEVISARVYYESDMAMVVSNAPFTRSACELAKKATVHLLHHTKLRQWAKQHVGSKPNVGLNAAEFAAVLNLHGFRVIRSNNGGYAVNTPAGVRYANTDGAFIQIAEGLLSSAKNGNGRPLM